MQKPSQQVVFAFMRQRSTMLGVAGLIVGVLALFGVSADVNAVAEILFILLSLAAILFKPDPDHEFYRPFADTHDYDGGGDSPSSAPDSRHESATERRQSDGL